MARVKKQETSFDMWDITVSTEDLQLILKSLSAQGLYLATPPVQKVRERIAQRYFHLSESLRLQYDAQRRGNVVKSSSAQGGGL